MIAFLLAFAAMAPTPGVLPIVGADGYTCPGAALADGTLRPHASTEATMACVGIAVRMIDAEGKPT